MKIAGQIALVAGGAVGVYALAKLLRIGAPAAAAPPKKADPCDALKPLGDGAVAACKLGTSLLGDVLEGRESGDAANRANIPLNGPVTNKVAIDPRFFETGAGYMVDPDGRNVSPAFKAAEIPIYRNGCVPLTGDARFAKCVAGTHAFNHFAQPGNGIVYNAQTRRGDTLTHRHITGVANLQKPFPIPCAEPNEKWWLSGQPACCPKGSIIARRHNPDGSVTAVCSTPSRPVDSNGNPLPPPKAVAGDQTSGNGGVTVTYTSDGHHVPPPPPLNR